MGENSKRCSLCCLEKQASNFSKDRQKKDGLSSHCRVCQKTKARRYYINNTKKVLERTSRNKRKKPWAGSYSCAVLRCGNPKAKCYKNYGGRGIKVNCTEEDFKNVWFRDKAFLLKRATIDRIDNDGNYEIGNIRFIENSENLKKRHALEREKRGNR